MQCGSFRSWRCSNKADTATTLPLVSESKPVVSESQEPTSSPEETTVVETVSGTIEGTEEQPEQAGALYACMDRLPIWKMEDYPLTVRQIRISGELILNVSQGVYLCIRCCFRCKKSYLILRTGIPFMPISVRQ